MVREILLTASLLLTVPAMGQKSSSHVDSSFNPKRSYEIQEQADSFVIYFGSAWQQLKPLHATYFSVVKKIEEGVWECRDYYIFNKNLRREGYYTDSSLTEAIGKFTMYNRNGRKWATGSFVNNAIDGWLTEYNYNNEQIADSVFYYNHHPLGEKITRNDNGNISSREVIDSLGAGTHESFYNNGYKSLTGSYSIGYQKSGTWINYFSNGQPSFKGVFKYGILLESDCFDSLGNPDGNCFVQTMPEFKGGKAAMMKFLSDNIRYPNKRLKKGTTVDGQVQAEFIVDETGVIESVEIVKSVDPEYDAEVVRVIKSMPPWHPGKMYNIPVKVYFMIPVTFMVH